MGTHGKRSKILGGCNFRKGKDLSFFRRQPIAWLVPFLPVRHEFNHRLALAVTEQ
jgi:hypothetical protein